MTIVAVLALMLAACGGDAQTTTTTTPDGEGTAAPTTTADADPAAFCQGRTVRIIIPYSPGGGFDTYARGLVGPLQAELPGCEVGAQNQPGGGGLVGANQIYLDEEGGDILVGLINFPGSIFATLTGREGVEFDMAEWEYLGRVTAVNPVLYTSEQSGITSAEALVNSEDPVTFGQGGVGSDAFYSIHMVGRSLDFPYEIITGYEGSSEADAALIAGEVEGRLQSFDSAQPIIESGANPIIYLSTERNEQIPDVPALVELTETPESETAMTALASLYDIGERIFVTGPGTPDETVEALGVAFLRAMESEEYQANMEEAGRPLDVRGREAVQELAQDVIGGMDALQPLLDGIEVEE